jgi:uncharacterized phiE125 gp8 family phage protein
MRLELIAGPGTEPITLPEAKAHLRVDSSEQDALIVLYIAAAREMVEQATGRALLPQDWELHLDAFPSSGPIFLPRPPLISILSVSTADAAGDLTEIDAAGYQVARSSGPTALQSSLLPAAGGSWPSTISGAADAVRIRYRAGYPSVSAVPRMLAAAILLIVADLYATREPYTLAKVMAHDTLPNLLWPYRILSV